MFSLFQSSTTCWGVIVRDYGLVPTVAASATFAALVLLILIMHRTLSPRRPKRVASPPTEKKKKKRKNHARTRGGGAAARIKPSPKSESASSSLSSSSEPVLPDAHSIPPSTPEHRALSPLLPPLEETSIDVTPMPALIPLDRPESPVTSPTKSSCPDQTRPRVTSVSTLETITMSDDQSFESVPSLSVASSTLESVGDSSTPEKARSKKGWNPQQNHRPRPQTNKPRGSGGKPMKNPKQLEAGQSRWDALKPNPNNPFQQKLQGDHPQQQQQQHAHRNNENHHQQPHHHHHHLQHHERSSNGRRGGNNKKGRVHHGPQVTHPVSGASDSFFSQEPSGTSPRHYHHPSNRSAARSPVSPPQFSNSRNWNHALPTPQSNTMHLPPPPPPPGLGPVPRANRLLTGHAPNLTDESILLPPMKTEWEIQQVPYQNKPCFSPLNSESCLEWNANHNPTNGPTGLLGMKDLCPQILLSSPPQPPSSPDRIMTMELPNTSYSPSGSIPFGTVKENPFAPDHTVNPFDDSDSQIEAELQELGGRMAGSILDF